MRVLSLGRERTLSPGYRFWSNSRMEECASEPSIENRSERERDHRSKRVGARINPAAVLCLLALCIAAFSCTGGTGNSDTPTATPQTSGGPPAVQEMILYVDIGGDVEALDPTSGQVWRRHLSSTTETVSQADCTRDGSRIAYLDLDTSDTKHRQIAIAGAQPRSQPFTIEGAVQGITWSPNDDKITFSEVVAQTDYQLWVVDVATGEQRQIASGQGIPGSPRWSPDGREIAFDVDVGGRYAVFVTDISSNSTPRGITAVQAGVNEPDWSPDGRSLIATASGTQQVTQIVTVDPASGNAQALTSSQVLKSLPRYSPDGRYVAFEGSPLVPFARLAALRRDNFGVWLMNADGSGERPLTDTAIDAILLGWCTRGAWLDSSWVQQPTAAHG
jgi:dipeptidyl aminopeptidase/acylaminoacyl peptidase